jgi:hypothetical protein
MERKFIGIGVNEIVYKEGYLKKTKGVPQWGIKNYHRIMVEEDKLRKLKIIYIECSGEIRTDNINMSIYTAYYDIDDFIITENGIFKFIELKEEPMKVEKKFLSSPKAQKQIDSGNIKESRLFFEVCKSLSEPTNDFIITRAIGNYKKKLMEYNERITLGEEATLIINAPTPGCKEDFEKGLKYLREDYKEIMEDLRNDPKKKNLYENELIRREQEQKEIKEEFWIYPKTLP